MELHVLPSGPIQTNAYLLVAPTLREAVLIDAPEGIWAKIEPLLRASQATLREVWITHGHWDHTQGGAEVVQQSGARVRAHRADQPLIETPEVMTVFLRGGIRVDPIRVDHWLTPGERWEALGAPVECRHVPGHCPGNVLFYFSSLGAAFVGDALFAGSVGRTDLPGGSAATLAESIRSQIYTLPDATAVHPGHGPSTRVADEKATNPFVRA
jgi:hydroxyacylglutathione hydrolase